MLVLSVFLLALLLATGCSATRDETVGLRIFDHTPRFFEDDVYFDIIDPTDASVIVSNLVSSGDWWPAEVYRLEEARPVILRVRYEGADADELHVKDLTADHRIDMVRDYDVYIHWVPHMQRPDLDDEDDPDFDPGPHWARKPVFEVKSGHTPVF